jgi:hypothetical protein
VYEEINNFTQTGSAGQIIFFSMIISAPDPRNNFEETIPLGNLYQAIGQNQPGTPFFDPEDSEP